MSFLLSLYAAVAVQKNVRDIALQAEPRSPRAARTEEA